MATVPFDAEPKSRFHKTRRQKRATGCYKHQNITHTATPRTDDRIFQKKGGAFDRNVHVMLLREGEGTALRLLRLAALRGQNEERRKRDILTSRSSSTGLVETRPLFAENTAIHSRYRLASSVVGIVASRLHLPH
ncbi:hypothetical protein ISCGN_024855 [Ixodes scapularis]